MRTKVNKLMRELIALSIVITISTVMAFVGAEKLNVTLPFIHTDSDANENGEVYEDIHCSVCGALQNENNTTCVNCGSSSIVGGTYVKDKYTSLSGDFKFALKLIFIAINQKIFWVLIIAILILMSAYDVCMVAVINSVINSKEHRLVITNSMITCVLGEIAKLKKDTNFVLFRIDENSGKTVITKAYSKERKAV